MENELRDEVLEIDNVDDKLIKNARSSFTYEKRTVNGMAIHIINTKIANIETETILKPLANTSYSGINGGFFDAKSYSKPPTSGSSICYNNQDVGKYVTVEGVKRIANFHENQQNDKAVSQRTLTIYKSGSNIKARIDNLTHVNQAFKLVGQSNVINCIGGYSPELTGSSIASGKAAIAINGSNAYLLFAPGVTQKLFNTMLDTGLGRGITRSNTVMMDGSGSAGMKNGSQYIGTERRYIYNCIRVK